jgi:hypothetical protein
MTNVGANRVANIGWKVSVPSANIASVRYRALLPLLALESKAVESTLVEHASIEANPDLDILILVKSFRKTDVLLAKSAYQQGTCVIFDLCDNIFIPEYGATRPNVTPSQIFDLLMPYTSHVVVPTQALAEVVRSRNQECDVIVIPDGIDTPELAIAAEKWLKEHIQLLPQAGAATSVRENVWLARLHALSDPNLADGARKRLVMHWLNPRIAFVQRTVSRWISPRFWLKKVWKIYDYVRTKFFKGAFKNSSKSNESLDPREFLILWFGNHGADHASFGITDLLLVKDALELAAKRHRVRLVVCSNNRKKFDALIKPMNLTTEYVEWSQKALSSELARADVVIIPNSLDDFSVCKSANRSVSALLQGVPVVATSTPALERISAFIYTGNFTENLLLVLGGHDAAKARAKAAIETITKEYGDNAIADLWLKLIVRAQRDRAKKIENGQALLNRESLDNSSGSDPQLLISVHLIQDLDLALPIAHCAVEKGIAVQVLCSEALAEKSPRVFTSLEQAQIPFRICSSRGGQFHEPWPKTAQALLTIAETNLGPHRWVRSLSVLAREHGAFVGTLQHGFENVGLSYSDDVTPIQSVNFCAQRIYTWGSLATLHSEVLPGVRAICLPVGCPKPVHGINSELSELLPPGAPIVGIFENLHWHRYSDAFRESFINMTRRLCEQNPNLRFIVKPHHAGRWLSSYKDQLIEPPSNLIIVDPLDPIWEPFTAPALFPHLLGIITTPSTVAVDAARAGLPTAIFSFDLGLENYNPLPQILEISQAESFVRALLVEPERQKLLLDAQNFVSRTIIDGDAAQAIVNNLVASAFARTDIS